MRECGSEDCLALTVILLRVVLEPGRCPPGQHAGTGDGRPPPRVLPRGPDGGVSASVRE